MTNIKKHFLIRFPIIKYEVLYAELINGTKTKTFQLDNQTHTQVIDLSEYLAALSFSIIQDALYEINRKNIN